MTANQLLNARHVVADAATAVSFVASRIARALAWQPVEDQGSALVADLERALEDLRLADRKLQDAITRVRVALEEKPGT